MAKLVAHLNALERNRLGGLEAVLLDC
jgi:hypothetical protein